MNRMRTLPAILLISLSLGVTASHPSGAKDKQSAPPFIVFVTVFNEQGFAFPGAQARLRRAGEKKDRWQALSDRRGEFAMRVPAGQEYELSVSAKGYQPIAQKVDARQLNRVDLTLRLVPASNEKKAEKKAPKEEPAPAKPPQEENE
jgi:hypothetical protein